MAAGVAAAAVMAASADASAEPWSEAHEVFPHGGARVVALPSGAFVAAQSGEKKLGALAATRAPGGAFGDPVRISEPQTAHLDDLFVGLGGDVAALFVTGGYPEGGWAVAVRRPGEGWQPPARFPTHRWIQEAGFDAAGNITGLYATNTYEEDSGGTTRTYVTNHTITRAADGSFGKPRTVAPASEQPFSNLVVGPDGRTSVMWWHGRVLGPSGATGAMEWASAPAGDEFGSATPMGVDWGYPVSLKVVSDANGDILAVWLARLPSYMGNPMRGPVMASFRPAGGDWRPPEELSGPNASVYADFEWDVAMNARGDAVVAWPGEHGSRLEMTYRPAGGAWEPATRGPAFPSSFEPAVAIGANGDAVALHAHEGTVEAFDHPAGGTFCRDERIPLPPDTPDPPDGRGYPRFPDVAVGPAGEAVAVWGYEAPSTAQWSHHRVGACAAQPVVTNFRLHRVSAPGNAKAASARRSHFTYWLTKPAAVTITIRRRVAHGERKHVATLHDQAHRGDNRTNLKDRIQRRIRNAGRYEATIVARDLSGHVSKRRTLRFRVDPKQK